MGLEAQALRESMNRIKHRRNVTTKTASEMPERHLKARSSADNQSILKLKPTIERRSRAERVSMDVENQQDSLF